MRFLHLVNAGFAGGVLRVVYEQAIHLKKLGYESMVVAGFPVSIFPGFPYVNTNFKLYFYPKFCSNTFIRVPLRAITELLPLRISYRPDWIIVHNFSFIRDAFKLREKFGSKLAILLHNFTVPTIIGDYLAHKTGLDKILLNKSHTILSNSDIVLTTSEKMRKMIREFYDVDSVVLPLGARVPSKVPSKRSGFVLFAARISSGKKADVVARIMSLVDGDVETIFAGSSSYTMPLVLRKIRKSGLRRYTIIPNITDHALNKLYDLCGAFISVNDEPFGLNIVEAAAHGAPICANAASGAAELFEDGVHGYFIKHYGKDVPVEEYAKRIEKLIGNEKVAYEMGYNAWKLLREKYTWTHHVMRLVSLLNAY